MVCHGNQGLWHTRVWKKTVCSVWYAMEISDYVRRESEKDSVYAMGIRDYSTPEPEKDRVCKCMACHGNHELWQTRAWKRQCVNVWYAMGIRDSGRPEIEKDSLYCTVCLWCTHTHTHTHTQTNNTHIRNELHTCTPPSSHSHPSTHTQTTSTWPHTSTNT